MLTACFRATRAVRRAAHQRDDAEAFWTTVGIEAGLLAYLVAASFIDRYRAEMLYWFVMYTACAYNVYVVRAGTAGRRRDGSGRRHGWRESDAEAFGLRRSARTRHTP